MISIFNGRERTLGGSTTEIYAQINVDFRQHLHIVKGARLSVFLAISLHANSRGWAWPSRGLLARETGYSINTISHALSDLCRITIKGQRLLLRYQPNNDGNFDSNHYLIFPSPREIAQFEHSQPTLFDKQILTPCTGFPCTVEPCTGFPCTVEPCTENLHTKDNHDKGDPKEKEETEAASKAMAAASITCSIHNKPMTLKSKDGDTWYSHQLPDGTWCKGAPGDQPTIDLTDPSRYITGKFADLIQH